MITGLPGSGVFELSLLAGAGIAECSCYSAMDVVSLGGGEGSFRGSNVAEVIREEKWRQVKVAACPPLNSSF